MLVAVLVAVLCGCQTGQEPPPAVGNQPADTAGLAPVDAGADSGADPNPPVDAVPAGADTAALDVLPGETVPIDAADAAVLDTAAMDAAEVEVVAPEADSTDGGGPLLDAANGDAPEADTAPADGVASDGAKIDSVAPDTAFVDAPVADAAAPLDVGAGAALCFPDPSGAGPCTTNPGSPMLSLDSQDFVVPSSASPTLTVFGVCSEVPLWYVGDCHVQVSTDHFATVAIDVKVTKTLMGYGTDFATVLSLASLSGATARVRLLHQNKWTVSQVWVSAAGVSCATDADCASGNPCSADPCNAGVCEHHGKDLQTFGGLGPSPIHCGPDKKGMTGCYWGEACNNGNCESVYGFDSGATGGWWGSCTDGVCSGYCDEPGGGIPGGCVVKPQACDDNNPCTVGDYCAAGSCSGMPKCSDGNSCTADLCDSQTQACSFDAAAMNGQPCGNVGQLCGAGVCK